jgi:hypothetical protein
MTEFVLHLSKEEFMDNKSLPAPRYNKITPRIVNVELGIIDVYRELDNNTWVYQLYFKDAESMFDFQLRYL